MTETPAADIVGLRQQPAFSANEMDALRAEIEALRAREAELEAQAETWRKKFLRSCGRGRDMKIERNELRRRLDKTLDALASIRGETD